MIDHASEMFRVLVCPLIIALHGRKGRFRGIEAELVCINFWVGQMEVTRSLVA
jgi:hypothetical protein